MLPAIQIHNMHFPLPPPKKRKRKKKALESSKKKRNKLHMNN